MPTSLLVGFVVLGWVAASPAPSPVSPPAAGKPGPATATSSLAAAASASSEDLTAEVAWSCVVAPDALLQRANASSFKPWLQDLRLPRAALAMPTACATCDVRVGSLPSCVWQDAAASATLAEMRSKACPEMAPGPGASPQASQDIFGAVDLTTLWQSWLVQAPPSSPWPQMSRRMGLGDVTQLCYSGQLRKGKAWSLDLLLRSKTSPRGIFSTLGPPIAPQIATDVSLLSVATVTASVIPYRVWNLLETLVAGGMPLQYTLLRMQLDAVEKAQHLRWADDVLGSKPAAWTFYVTRDAQAVAVLEGADGAQAVTFLAAAVASLADLMPGLQFTVFKKAVTTATLDIPSGSAASGGTIHLAFFPKAVVVATSADALAPHLKKRDRVGRVTVLRPEAATVFGRLNASHGGAWQKRLSPVWRPSIIKNADGAWFFSPSPQGWRGSVEMTVGRQTIGQ